jgi:hypothetical protein
MKGERRNTRNVNGVIKYRSRLSCIKKKFIVCARKIKMLRAEEEKNTTRSLPSLKRKTPQDRREIPSIGDREERERERVNTIFSPLTIPRPVLYTRVAGVLLENMHISTR